MANTKVLVRDRNKERAVNLTSTEQQAVDSAATGTLSTSGFNGCKVVEAISTTKVKSTFDVKKLSGKSTAQIEVGCEVVIGDFVFQMGYRKNSNTTSPFTDYDYRTPMNSISFLNGGRGPFTFNAKNVFEIYKYSTAVYRYALNGTDIIQFEMLEDLPITHANLHILTISASKIPTINFYPAIEYESGGNYIHALGGRNTYGAGIAGFEGSEQDGSLRDNELNAGSSIPFTDYAATLWQ